MIVSYIRSSSYGQHSMCAHSFFLTYTLGMRFPAGKKACLGTISHKALECLAWVSKCRAEGLTEYEDETFGLLKVADVTPEWATNAAYAHYKETEPFHDWKDRFDLRDCHEWVKTALTMNGGMFDPRNQDVVMPEQRFDFTIDKPWARYSYDTPTGKVEGQLGIKGTMDLVVRNPDDPGSLQVIDYKTGKRLDWATGQEKTFEKLSEDPQLLLYYYACTLLYPKTEHFDFTIIYINDGGAFRLCFGPEHVGMAEEMLRKKFEEIRDDNRPKLTKTWRCQRLCPFGKNKSEHDPSKTICEFFEGEVRQKGADAVTFEYTQGTPWDQYGSGGGRKSSE